MTGLAACRPYLWTSAPALIFSLERCQASLKSRCQSLVLPQVNTGGLGVGLGRVEGGVGPQRDAGCGGKEKA
jgi:hypothetical protein